MKKCILFVALLLCLLLIGGCGDNKRTPRSAGDGIKVTSTISEDEKFGSANIALSQKQFEAAGFQLGDSCDISFENGLTLTNVPYYNGYYVKRKDPVIVAYPGFSCISVTYGSRGIWKTEGLKDGESITIRLNKAGEYADIQKMLGQSYSFDRADYTSDVQFCNFRVMVGGNLKENYFFRGASPVDNSRNRAPYTDKLLKENNIRQILDLADAEEDLAGYFVTEDFNSPYTANLYQNGKVIPVNLSAEYESEEYHRKVAEGLRKMMQGEGPVYLHCTEGKDRTGFVCVLLEALAGAAYSEMQSDYMTTYKNYYSIFREKTPEKYEAVSNLYFNSFMSYLHETEDPEALIQADYTQDAADYLLDGGMTQKEVDQLRKYITK